MLRACLALAVVLCGIANGASPSYSAASFVNTGNYAPGPFAPSSVVTIFGADLARSEQTLTPSDIRDNTLPTELNFTRVYVDNIPAPLLFVGPTQVNFMIPSKQLPGNVRIRVVKQGQTGPEVILPVVDAAPALFAMPDGSGFAIATHAVDGSLITPDAPARGGEAIVIWATGLGKTTRNPNVGEIPTYVAWIVNREALKLSVGGEVLYAGLTPGSAGLFQINLVLPPNPGTDPEFTVTIGGVSSAPGLKLAIR